MKVKEESTKAGLQLNIKETNIMTAENFNIKNKEIEIVKDFAFVQSSIQMETAATKSEEDWGSGLACSDLIPPNQKQCGVVAVSYTHLTLPTKA